MINGDFSLEVFSLEQGFENKKIIEYENKIGYLQNEPFYFILKNNSYKDIKFKFLEQEFTIKSYSNFCSKDIIKLNFDDKNLNGKITIDILDLKIFLFFYEWTVLRKELRSNCQDKRKEFKRL